VKALAAEPSISSTSINVDILSGWRNELFGKTLQVFADNDFKV
jgi:hypothetical protein